MLSARSQRGFTLIEAMIAIVILAIGLLGTAKLQVGSHQYQMESYQRAQAMVLMQDMVSRLSANRYAASCYVVTTNAAGGTPWLGTGYTGSPACSSGTIAQQTAAINDLTAWNQALLGASETIGSGTSATKAGAAIDTRGCISYDSANDQYVITVVWQGLMQTAAPPSGLACAKNQYGAESLGQRRAVSAIVKFGLLS